MDETNDSERSIARRDLPAVVRRAAELAAFADDADEQLSEQEVIRIAAELGLAPRHVRQALYEGATEETTASFLDRYFPPPRLAITRAVPMEVAAARRALEDYLVTQEYLQIVRRQADSTTFEPASDAVYLNLRGLELLPIEGLDVVKINRLAKIVRALAFAAVEGIKSGHPGHHVTLLSV